MLAIFYTMYFMRSVLLPIVLAVLFRPIVRALARIKVPPIISAAVILAALLTLIGYSVSSLMAPTASWLEKAPAGFSELQHKLMPLKKSMTQVAQASGEIEKLATPDSPTKTAVEVKRHLLTETLYMRTPPPNLLLAPFCSSSSFTSFFLMTVCL